MATRRMRIKAVINVPRGGAKTTESQEIVPSSPAPAAPLPVTDSSPLNVPLSPAPVPSPRICSGPVSPAPGGHGAAPLSPAPDPTPPPPLDIPLSTPTSPFLPSRAGTPPVGEKMPSSPKSPASWQLQRPSPSKSPAALPPSGSILRRSPSPALINTARSTSSPGPPAILSLLSSPVKSPVPNYSSSFQKANVPPPLENPKFITRTPVIIMPSSLSLGSRPCDNYPSSSSPGLEISLKSPPGYFRPPPSPSTYQDSFHSVKSPPGVISRPSPAQSPVFGVPGIRTSSSFLSQHLNSNSNSADSHEVAALMSNSSNVPFSPTGSLYPPSPDKLQRYSGSGRGSENSYPAVGAGAFSIVSSNKAICSPSFSQSVLDNPEAMKRRMEERKKDTIPNPTKFSQARKEFFEKIVTGQAPERAKMTMLHFTFYNPPKPDGTGGTTKAGSKKSRSRASSMCSESDSRHDINLDNDKGKALSAPSSIASRRTTASSMGSGGSVVSVAGQDDAHSEAGSTASNGSSNVPGPRVKVGPDGQLIIDEKSLVVETSESQRARKQIEDMEVVSGANYAVGSSGFYRFKRNYRRGHDWTEKETIRFYRALNQCGTDFSMMLSLFPNRTRQELKSKFKREDRKNPDMVSKALASCHFDPDEGISSDEELALYYGKSKDGQLTEKEKLLQEEAEMEEVICSSEDATANGAKKKKKKEKPKTVAFTKEQLKEMQATSDNVSGPGTSKGKLWNSRVIGLPPKGKLPPIGVAEGTTQLLTHIKSEVQSQAVLKSAKKKSTKKAMLPTVSDSGGVEATVPIFISEGVIGPPPPVDIATVKKEKADSIIPTTEKREQNQTSADRQAPVGNAKRRARLPKTKPNVKALKGGDTKRQRGGKDIGQNEAVNVVANESNNSSQGPCSVSTSPMCVDLFRFDASDPLGFKVVPTPLPVVQETELQGDEEGADGLVIVDLDELNSMTAAAEGDAMPQASGSTNNSRKRKKSASSNTDGIPVTTTRILGDPYGKSVMTMASIKRERDKDIGTSSTAGAAPNKKVKVLPYRVPGPGGILPPCQSSLATELEIEIELNSAPSSES